MKKVVLWVFLLALTACERSRYQVEVKGRAMGTTWRLVVVGLGEDVESHRGVISSVLSNQEKRFSNWILESEVKQLERGEGEASPEMARLLELAERVKVESGEAFDVGWNDGLDLGGIAKGWAVDRVVEELECQGLSNFVFELGGEVSARGDGPDGEGWKVGIESPSPSGAGIVRTVVLNNEALATSGNYQQPEHLKDGRTGEVIAGEFRSVSVVMPTCAEADAWATALFVLEEEPEGFSGTVFRN